MFGIGTTEILIILVVALIVIGPKKLPDVARTLGKALGEFKRMSSDVKRTIDLEADRAEESHRTTQAEKTSFPEGKGDAEGTTPSNPQSIAEETDLSENKTAGKNQATGANDVAGKEA